MIIWYLRLRDNDRNFKNYLILFVLYWETSVYKNVRLLIIDYSCKHPY